MTAVVDLGADGCRVHRACAGCRCPDAARSRRALGADRPFKVGLDEVAIGMTLPGWACTIARERLSKRHRRRSLANARLTDPAVAVDVGFLDCVVSPDRVASALAVLDRKAHATMMREFRGETLVRMSDQIAAERNG